MADEDQTGVSAAKALLRHIASYGTPDEIQSDGGPQFYSEMVTALYRITNIDKLTSTPYSHEENGIAERAIKTVQEHLRALLFEREVKESWSVFLPLVQRIMNASQHQTIGCSPAQIIFGNSIDLDRHIVHDPVDMNEIELPALITIASSISPSLSINVLSMFYIACIVSPASAQGIMPDCLTIWRTRLSALVGSIIRFVLHCRVQYSLVISRYRRRDGDQWR